jgi:CRP-like cAMP-binding protein
MATCIATFKNRATTTTPGRPFVLLPAANHKLTVASRVIGGVQEQAAAIDLQDPLMRFMAGKSRREYSIGESIFTQGDVASSVFYILSGKVKLTVVSMNGKEAVIAHLPSTSFFGEASLAGEAHRVASARALETSTIVRIDKSAMQDLLHREPQFAEKFLAHMLARNNRMQADLVDQLFNSSEKRLARLLMLMANSGQATKQIPVIAKISQESLAEMIGTTRSRVCYFLNRFRELGYIDYSSAGMLINSSLVNVVLRD